MTQISPKIEKSSFLACFDTGNRIFGPKLLLEPVGLGVGGAKIDFWVRARPFCPALPGSQKIQKTLFFSHKDSITMLFDMKNGIFGPKLPLEPDDMGSVGRKLV